MLRIPTRHQCPSYYSNSSSHNHSSKACKDHGVLRAEVFQLVPREIWGRDLQRGICPSVRPPTPVLMLWNVPPHTARALTGVCAHQLPSHPFSRTLTLFSTPQPEAKVVL